jgi:O-antigen/teichoic acid export membrane protein
MKLLRQPISSDRLSLRANFSWTLVGNVLYRASQWGLVVVLAKLSSPELVGQYVLALAITAPVFMFSNLGLTTVQTTDVNDLNNFGEYLGLRTVTSLLALIFIAGILLLSGYEPDVLSLIALVSFTKFSESISDTSYGLMQKHERLDLVAKSLIIRGLISLVAFTVVLYFFHSILLAVTAQLVVWSGILFAFDLRNARFVLGQPQLSGGKSKGQSTKPRYEPKILVNLFRLSLPLGIVAGLGSLSLQVPRYALEHFADTRELGVFGAIASLSVLGSLVTSALSSSTLPRLAHLFSQRAFEQFNRLIYKLMGIGFAIGVIGIVGATLFGKIFLTLAYTKEYAAYNSVFIVIMINITVDSTFNFCGTGLSATQQFGVQVFIHILKVSSVVLSCLLLIPRWGALGAAWTMVISSIVSACVYAFILRRTIRKSKQQIIEGE